MHLEKNFQTRQRKLPFVWQENGAERHGTARAVDALGGLVTETPAGTVTLRWGEVSIRL